jgi:hypothetical protein
MLVIDENNNIWLTRGDSAVITLTVTENGTPYDYSEDLTQFTVKRNTVTEDVIIQKTFTGNSIALEPNDTKDLYYQDLKFDVQLITPEGEVHTVITPHDFILTEEVNFNVSRT